MKMFGPNLKVGLGLSIAIEGEAVIGEVVLTETNGFEEIERIFSSLVG